MTLRQFNNLDETIQAQILWEKGVHVATKDDEVYQYLLYQLDNFYVEVWFNVEQEIIQRFRSFADTSLLDPYLVSIDIESCLYG